MFGNSTIRKTKSLNFSSVAIAQAYEQNSAIVKGDDGAILLTVKESRGLVTENTGLGTLFFGVSGGELNYWVFGGQCRV